MTQLLLVSYPLTPFAFCLTCKTALPPAASVLISCSYSYHESLNPVIALLDPALHTPTYVRARSSVLFTAILSVACRFMRPGAWKRCNALGQTLLGRALADGICSIEYVQALSLMTFWKDSQDSSSWRKVGLAIRMAYELNLHAPREKPLPAMEQLAREQLVSVRLVQGVGYSWTFFNCRTRNGLGFVSCNSPIKNVEDLSFLELVCQKYHLLYFVLILTIMQRLRLDHSVNFYFLLGCS